MKYKITMKKLKSKVFLPLFGVATENGTEFYKDRAKSIMYGFTSKKLHDGSNINLNGTDWQIIML